MEDFKIKNKNILISMIIIFCIIVNNNTVASAATTHIMTNTQHTI